MYRQKWALSFENRIFEFPSFSIWCGFLWPPATGFLEIGQISVFLHSGIWVRSSSWHVYSGIGSGHFRKSKRSAMFGFELSIMLLCSVIWWQTSEIIPRMFANTNQWCWQDNLSLNRSVVGSFLHRVCILLFHICVCSHPETLLSYHFHIGKGGDQ